MAHISRSYGFINEIIDFLAYIKFTCIFVPSGSLSLQLLRRIGETFISGHKTKCRTLHVFLFKFNIAITFKPYDTAGVREYKIKFIMT